MHFKHKNNGTCSAAVEFDIDNGRVYNVKFLGGCRGNTQGVARLAEGMLAEEVITRCEGILCREGTSCPDQFAKAVREAVASASKVNEAVPALVEGADPDCSNCKTPCGREKILSQNV